jgi:hypothetical protein
VIELDAVQRRMDAIKAGGGGPVYTNYFRQPLAGPIVSLVAQGSACVFLVTDHDFFRPYFYARGLASLVPLLAGLTERELCLDLITKKEDPKLEQALAEAGFSFYGLYRRYTNRTFPAKKTNRALRYAKPEQADELYRRLWLDFDKFKDHLPDRDKVNGQITAQQVLVTRGEPTDVGGYLIFDLQGLKCNLNYWAGGDDDALGAYNLLVNFYGLMHDKGITSGFAWVDAEKEPVIRVHQTFGFRFDGLMDRIFVKR